MISGGGQQNGLRAGTLPVPLIAGFAAAVKELNNNKEMEINSLQQLRDCLLNELRKELTITVHGSLINRHPGNLHLAIKGVDSLQLLNNVQPYLAFSLGSACDGLNREYSSLMKGIGVSREEAENAFRLCVGKMTSSEDIVIAASIITREAKKILL